MSLTKPPLFILVRNLKHLMTLCIVVWCPSEGQQFSESPSFPQFSEFMKIFVSINASALMYSPLCSPPWPVVIGQLLNNTNQDMIFLGRIYIGRQQHHRKDKMTTGLYTAKSGSFCTSIHGTMPTNPNTPTKIKINITKS